MAFDQVGAAGGDRVADDLVAGVDHPGVVVRARDDDAGDDQACAL